MPFVLDDWKPEKSKNTGDMASERTFGENLKSFRELANQIYADITVQTSKDRENMSKNAILQKEAILGYPESVKIYKDKITDYLLNRNRRGEWYPAWYSDLVSGIFHEVWGLAGLAEFFSEKYKDSSSAKIIGENIYFFVNGRQQLMPQKIDAERRAQLVKALCTDDKGAGQTNKDSHEVYMQDGSRVKIYNRAITMKDQDSIVIRRYVIPEYTFDVQVERKTIEEDMVPLFKEMIKLGYNLLFTGAVRTAKTTFLQTFLSYEDPTLEGMLIQTDPEVDVKKILPNAPVISLIADTDERMNNIVKEILRSDMDWLAYAEARDGASLLTAIRVAKKGTRRVKLTFHSRSPEAVCSDIATEIISYAPAMSLSNTEKMVASSFDYIFHFIQGKDRATKKLKSISELSYDKETDEIKVVPICEYDILTDKWYWTYHISNDKRLTGREEDHEAFERFETLLKELADKHPKREEI